MKWYHFLAYMSLKEYPPNEEGDAPGLYLTVLVPDHCLSSYCVSSVHTCDTSRIIREAPGNGADLPGSRKGRKTSRKLNIPITIFFTVHFLCVYTVPT